MSKKKKIYVIKSPGKPRFFDNWQECWENVKGVSRCVYKSFKKMKDAKIWAYGEQVRERFVEVEIPVDIKKWIDDNIPRSTLQERMAVLSSLFETIVILKRKHEGISKEQLFNILQNSPENLQRVWTPSSPEIIGKFINLLFNEK